MSFTENLRRPAFFFFFLKGNGGGVNLGRGQLKEKGRVEWREGKLQLGCNE